MAVIRLATIAYLILIAIAAEVYQLSSKPRNPEKLSNLLDVPNCGDDVYKHWIPKGPRFASDVIYQYSWLGFVYLDSEKLCNGVLIHPAFVLSTASCMQKGWIPNSYSIQFNELGGMRGDTENWTLSLIYHFLEQIFVHPSYENLKQSNNIALLQLIGHAITTPICLPPKGSPIPTSAEFTVIGWKKRSRWNKPMIRTTVQLIDFKNCSQHYAQQGITLDATGGQVCSKISFQNASRCTHNLRSAPFQYLRNGTTEESRYFLAAIFNFGGKNCSRNTYADVFTNVGHYGDWIRKTVMKNAPKPFY